MKHLTAAAAAGTIAGVLGLLPAPAAQANTYSVYSCKGPDGAPAPTDGWKSYDGARFSSPANDCASGGALEAYLSDTLSQPAGASAWWEYTPPANTALRSFSLKRSMHSGGNRAFQSPGALISWPDIAIGHAGSTCFQNFGCTDLNGDYSATVDDPAHVNAVVTCGGGQDCQPFTGSGKMASVRISAFKAILADDTSPDVQSVGGTLLASGSQRGVKTVSVRATDTGAGVYRALIEIKKPGDSSFSVAKAISIDDNGGRCAPIAGASGAYEFSRGQPCKLSASGDLDFDTSILGDGQYELRVSVEDASGNRVTAAAPQTLTVRNAPDSTQAPAVDVPSLIKAGDTLTCHAGTFDPTPDKVEFSWLVGGVLVDGAAGSTYAVRAADVSRSIVCRVKATKNGQSTTVDSAPVGGPNQPGGRRDVITTSNAANGANGSNGLNGLNAAGGGNPVGANGSGGLVRSARFTAASKRTKRIRYGQRAVLVGQLKDASGKPIVRATVDVYKRIARPGTYMRKVGSVVTNADGIYRYVAPVGVSRYIRFAYRATLSSGDYSDQVDVALKVRAKIRLRATPAHVRSYGVIKLAGKVLGTGLPSRGALVEIQVKQGGKWRTVIVKRTKKKGRFSFKHKLVRTRHGDFTFRVRLRNQTSVPLTAATSKQIKVRVG